MKINFSENGEKPLKRFPASQLVQVTPLKRGVNEKELPTRSPLFPLTHHASRITRPDSAVALVITLILLSVITFMAVAFLVMSRSEKGSVTNTTDLTIARLMADSAQHRAIAELLAPIMATTNEFNFDLLVSTNYINPLGFNANGGPSYTSLTNVCYNYPNGRGLTKLDDIYRNLANLLYSPRAPVWASNRFFGSNEFVYYLDLNRNGRYDTNGYLPVMNPTNGFYNTNHVPIPAIIPGNTLYQFFAGDPEWIGVLERPDFPHSPSNKFVGRIAYLVVPVGKTLDINYIHNYSRLLTPGMTAARGDGFVRNMGLASWENNLAAFLVDLNTNYWPFPNANSWGTPYFYDTVLANGNRGAAFDDALALLGYRYGKNYKNLLSVNGLYGTAPNSRAPAAFTNDFFDDYAAGPLMTGSHWLPYGAGDNDQSQLAFAWSGSENVAHFFSTQELYDKTKTTALGAAGLTFSDRLAAAGTNYDSYNRYTYFRLLSQIGTDSAPQPEKMNLNWDNLVQTNTTTGTRSSTNFFPWRPIEFFTNAAARLLADTFPNEPNINISHIQIWPTNYYTPSVHRLLQLAANIYDATTNRTLRGLDYPYLPSVFRPSFAFTNDPSGSNVVFINGFSEVTNTAFLASSVWRDLSIATDRAAVGQPNTMIYGIPLVVGAKKGYPNFNEFAMQTQVRVDRKLEFRRSSTGGPVSETNQMYVVAISNVFGVEAWNSYSNAFPRNLRMTVVADTIAVITNELGTVMLSKYITNIATTVTIPANTWQGFQLANSGTQPSFRIPLDPSTNSFLFLTNSTWSIRRRGFVPLSSNFERNFGFPIPQWFLSLNTRLRFFLVDADTDRIVDYVNLNSSEPSLDIAEMLQRDDPDVPASGCGSRYTGQDIPDHLMWCTNKARADIQTPTYGILNQISLALGHTTPKGCLYDAYDQDPNSAQPGSTMCQINFFRGQFDEGPIPAICAKLTPCTSTDPIYKTNVFHAPFVPRKDIYYYTSWQANDPLVHYTISDLTDATLKRIEFNSSSRSSMANLRAINGHYEPWAAVATNKPSGSSSLTSTNMALKDALVTRSENWDFPTNKFPNIGWLGRVHRGTPWQTVYMKAAATDQTNTWPSWCGHVLRNWDGRGTTLYDSLFSHPTNDYRIFDLFTTSVNENASRGQLSVNQTNLAAWSAVLSGIIVQTSIESNSYTVIDPVGVYDASNTNTYPPLLRIYNGINSLRTNYYVLPGTPPRTNYFCQNGMFSHVGDILAAPELTEKSPYLANINKNLLNDEVYERIPQQMLSLLRADSMPRLVIYAYGQTLKPADHSLVTSGPFFGMCTNYQVTAEVATRTVLRIEGVQKNPHTMKNLHPIIESFNVLPPD